MILSHHVTVHLSRIAAAVAALTLALTPLPGHAAAAPHRAAAAVTQGTTTVHVRPVDAAGHLRPGYHVTHRHGRTHCLLGAIAVGTAYRCFSGNNHIYDPCWVQAGGTDHVLCLRDPWRHGVVRLHVTRGFDGSYGTAPVSSWALRLAAGPRCVRVQGAAGVVGGRGISATCLDGTTVLLGEADTSGDVWRIRAARDPSGGYDYAAIGFRSIGRSYVGRPSLRP